MLKWLRDSLDFLREILDLVEDHFFTILMIISIILGIILIFNPE